MLWSTQASKVQRCMPTGKETFFIFVLNSSPKVKLRSPAGQETTAGILSCTSLRGVVVSVGVVCAAGLTVKVGVVLVVGILPAAGVGVVVSAGVVFVDGAVVVVVGYGEGPSGTVRGCAVVW